MLAVQSSLQSLPRIWQDLESLKWLTPHLLPYVGIYLILIEKMKSCKLDDKHGHQLLMFLFICHAKEEFQITTLFLDIACS